MVHQQKNVMLKNLVNLLSLLTFLFYYSDAAIEKNNNIFKDDLKEIGSNEKTSTAYFGQVKRFFQLSIICSTVCIQLISFGLIMNNIDEYTPLVLFSWWRNKIS